jgi:membrane-associated phospholipid phosphatase
LSQLPNWRVYQELEGTAMRFSTLVVALTAAFFCTQTRLRAGDYSFPNLPVTLAGDNGTNIPDGHRDYLLSYQDERGFKKYLDWLWRDPVNLLTRPAFWDGGQWTTFGVEAGITGALFPLDNTVRDSNRDNRSASLDDGLNTVRSITGGGTYFFAASAAIFGSGLVVQNEKLADSGFLAFESVAYAGGLEEGIKFVTGRKRPNSASNQYQFQGPGGHAFNSSFVSGESTVAFAFASSVSEVWQNPWVTWPLYMFAGAVGAQRITDNKHWLSDVVGGAFLGQAVGKTIVRMHYSHDVEGKVVPFVANHTVGLQVTFAF